jgi:putative tryptophan/tyrosine transport system substrate-binding protein
MTAMGHGLPYSTGLPPAPLPPERQVLNRLAVHYRLPIIYQDRSFAVEGGLLSYGADMVEMHRRDAPPYVDRILRGAKPGDLPIQFPTKFQLVVNLKTAKAMGLTIPEPFLNLQANEVIE